MPRRERWQEESPSKEEEEIMREEELEGTPESPLDWSQKRLLSLREELLHLLSLEDLGE